MTESAEASWMLNRASLKFSDQSLPAELSKRPLPSDAERGARFVTLMLDVMGDVCSPAVIRAFFEAVASMSPAQPDPPLATSGPAGPESA